MILPDGKTTYYSLASLFCTQVYSALSDFADKLGGRLPIRVNYVLDEFGNFTKIPEFATSFLLVAVGGSALTFLFNLWHNWKKNMVGRLPGLSDPTVKPGFIFRPRIWKPKRRCPNDWGNIPPHPIPCHRPSSITLPIPVRR